MLVHFKFLNSFNKNGKLFSCLCQVMTVLSPKCDFEQRSDLETTAPVTEEITKLVTSIL